MKFRNYCVIVLGNVDGAKEEIKKISETDVKFANTKGLIMATFSSVATPSELKAYFQSFNRNFFLFEIGHDNYGVNLNDATIMNHLFGEYEENGDSLANDLTTKLFKNIKKTISDDSKNKMLNIEKMTEEDRTILLDKLLDKGVNNWDDTDKTIVNKLTKNDKNT